MRILFAAALALLVPVYIAANVFMALVWMRWVWPVMRRMWDVLQAVAQQQAKVLSPVRLSITTGLCAFSFALCLWLLHQPLTLPANGLTLLGYVLVMSALAVSLPARLPVIQRCWRDPAIKLLVWAVPPFLAFVAKGYAGQWIGEMLGTSSVNAGMASFAGTVLLLCLIPAVLLGLIALVFEVLALLVLPFARFAPGRVARWALWVLTFFTLFFGAFLGSTAATQLVGGRLGSALLLWVAFEFDGSPAQYCALSEPERELAKGADPQIKVLHLGSSQERALLVRRSTELFRPVVLKRLKQEPKDHRRIDVLRVVDCYQTGSPPS